MANSEHCRHCGQLISSCFPWSLLCRLKKRKNTGLLLNVFLISILTASVFDSHSKIQYSGSCSMLSPGEGRCQSFLVWSVMNCHQSFLHSFCSNIQIYHQEYHAAAAALGGKCLSSTYSNVSWKVFIIFFPLPPASSVKPHVYHVWVLQGWERVAFLISSDCFGTESH